MLGKVFLFSEDSVLSTLILYEDGLSNLLDLASLPEISASLENRGSVALFETFSRYDRKFSSLTRMLLSHDFS